MCKTTWMPLLRFEAILMEGISMTKNRLRYKDFIGSVEFSEPDSCFFGEILGINDLVVFEGDSVTSLKESFFEAVDDYIVLCAEVGKQPLKSFKGSFNVRISPELHKEAAMMANEKGLTFNAFVNEAIHDAVHTRAS